MLEIELTDLQKVILECIGALPEPLPRSSLAKLLVGSLSSRIAHLQEHRYFGRFPDLSRKAAIHHIDILIQYNYLRFDIHKNLILAEKT